MTFAGRRRRRRRRPPPSCLSPSPSIGTLLCSCRSLRGLAQLHSRLIRSGLHHHHAVLFRFAGACDRLAVPSYAASVLDSLPSAPVSLHNAVLASHSRHSPLAAALSHFNGLRRATTSPPDEFSFPSLLRSCARAACLPAGSAAHAAAIRLGLDTDLVVRTALVHFYAKCGAASAARDLFDSMPVKNELSWSAILLAYINTGDLTTLRELFDLMPLKNVIHWNVMIDGCVKFGALEEARRLFDRMPERSAAACTSLISGYAKAGDMGSARLLFEELEDRDLFSWSAMISGYAQNGCPGDALRVFLEFYERGIQPDELIVVGLMSACAQLNNLTLARWVDEYIVRNSIDMENARILAGLVDMNAKCGSMDRAAVLFESMPERDVFSYCSMMQGHCLHGSAAKAIELFSQMLLEGLSPDTVAFTVVLTACSNAGLVEEGKKYFDMMRNEYLIVPSGDHYACMVDLLGRSGMLKDAYELIMSMPGKPHAGAWGALLGACKLHCDIELGNIVAKKLFDIEPHNAGNYVSLSNIYANVDRWADVSEVRTEMTGKGVRKKPGCTWILQ